MNPACLKGVNGHPGRAVAAISVALLAGSLLAGCGRDYATSTEGSGDAPVAVVQTQDDDGYHGVALDQPIAMPAAVLTATDGSDFDLQADTAGRVTLVYAGYTNCPDVCPTTVADLAAALRGMPESDQEQVDVLMLSTDPERDTTKRLRAWLDQFDSGFEGLTGETDVVLAAINAMGIDVVPPEKQPDGSVTVEHGAQVLAFTPAGEAPLLWTSGTTPTEYRDDVTALLSTLS